MHVTFDDRTFEFKAKRMSSTELIGLKRYGGWQNKAAYLEDLSKDDPEALQALYWLLLRRSGQRDLKYSEVPEFWEYSFEVDEEEKAEARQNMTPEQIAKLDPEALAELGFVDGEDPTSGDVVGEAVSAVSDATSPLSPVTSESGPGRSDDSAPTSTSTSAT